MRNLLTHTCDVVKAGAAANYNQAVTSWTSGTTTTAEVPCLMQPYVASSLAVRELAAGAVIGTHTLVIEMADAPVSLRAVGAERTHRILNWTHDRLTDAGPFEIVEIQDAGGQGHHLELTLRRAQG